MYSILIIDSNPAVRELFVVELALAGYNPVPLTEFGHIKNKIKTMNVDLVVIDLYMNGSNRWDLLADIKKEKPGLPVIVVSAFDDCKNDPRLVPADGYVIKSSNFDEILAKIRRTLQNRKFFSSAHNK